MMWKALYGRSAGDHGTLAFFRSQLRRIPVTADAKKDENACVDLIYTVMKGHILASACEVLKVSGLEDQPTIPAGLKTAGRPEQLAYISDIAQAVVENCTLVEAALETLTTVEMVYTITHECYATMEPWYWRSEMHGVKVMERG